MSHESDTYPISEMAGSSTFCPMNRIQVAAPAPRRFQGVAGRSGVVEQIHEDDKVRAELAERREAVRDKMRRIR